MRNTYYPGEPELMMYRLKSSANPEASNVDVTERLGPSIIFPGRTDIILRRYIVRDEAGREIGVIATDETPEVVLVRWIEAKFVGETGLMREALEQQVLDRLGGRTLLVSELTESGKRLLGRFEAAGNIKIVVAPQRFLSKSVPYEIKVLKPPVIPKAEAGTSGTCYSDAWRFLVKQGEGFLIHGSVQLSAEAPRINHAWVELTTGWVWEPQTKSYFTIEDFKINSPIEHHRYTVEEAAIMLARVGKHGPWTGEERAAWLRGSNPTSRKAQLDQQGREITARLGNGINYYGPWLPYGEEGEFMGHFFQDDAVTGTSFVASTYEEAKEALVGARKNFDAEPPVFAD